MAQQQQGDNSPVVKDREIVIELFSPTVPVIDLIDMPGLTATNSDDAFELLKSYCGRHDSNSLYLFVVEAAAKPEADYALQFLRQRRLKPRSVGVMTKFDELGEKVFDKAVARVLSPSEGDGGVCLQPYGWVATMSDPLEARNDAERLKLQSEAEESFFRDDDRRRALLTEGHATTHALAKRLVRCKSCLTLRTPHPRILPPTAYRLPPTSLASLSPPSPLPSFRPLPAGHYVYASAQEDVGSKDSPRYRAEERGAPQRSLLVEAWRLAWRGARLSGEKRSYEAPR